MCNVSSALFEGFILNIWKMRKVSLQTKIGILMSVAVLLVISIGFLAYRSLSSVVSLIYTDIRPDYRLITIKAISIDLEKAENNIRMYTITRKDSLLTPSYDLTDSINKKVDILLKESMNDHELFIQISAINNLIENKYYVWGRMIDIYEDNNIESSLTSLSNEISNTPKLEQNIFKRLFNHKQEYDLNTKQISEKIIDIEKQHRSKQLKIQEEEAQLTHINNKITAQFYTIIQQIEVNDIKKTKVKADKANYLANKTYYWLVLFSFTGSLLALLVIFIVGRYVRKTHAYQKALEQSKIETENLARTKELFMANVSHEIRTPLNALAGFLEQILGSPLNYEVREKLNIVKSSSDHLIRIISDILDFSKLHSGKLTLEKIHFKVENILKELFIIFENQAKFNHNQLIYEPSKNEIPVLIGDPHRLQQIFYNLLSNAIKFTYQGRVLFSAELVDNSNNNVKIAIKVEDTGMGIPKDKQDDIFDDFTQAEPEITRKYGGTGLGLSIVKKLVELNQGSIDIKSEPGKGSTFTCCLYYELGDKEKIIPSNSLKLNIPDGIHNLKVLVVDDEEYNRLLIESIFKKWNVNFSEAVNGLEAIEEIKSQDYNLVLMDARMPVIDGANATKFIRNKLDKPKSNIPIIAITAALSTNDKEMYFLSGTNAVLEKPFSEQQLLDTIISVVNGEMIKFPKIKDVLDDVLVQEEIDPTFKELHRLTGNDKNFIKEMLTKFMRGTTDGLKSMSESRANGDIEQIISLAHKLSSPCRHLGAMRLLHFLKQIENDSKGTHSHEHLQELIIQAKNEFEKVKQHIFNHLNSLA
jgi:signal transduction histidine kinase/DNA-binding NarL/FixJ family response regulator